MMDVADQDGDGFVNKEEFFRVLKLSKMFWENNLWKIKNIVWKYNNYYKYIIIINYIKL